MNYRLNHQGIYVLNTRCLGLQFPEININTDEGTKMYVYVLRDRVLAVCVHLSYCSS